MGTGRCILRPADDGFARHPGTGRPLALDADRAITSQPIGHYEFCQKYKDECEVKSRSVMPAKVTEHGWAVIREVNDAVNRNITPMTDLELYGKDEVWPTQRRPATAKTWLF